MTRPALGSLNLIQTAYSGFGYPATGQVVSVLGDGTGTGGNAVLQQGALPFRQATVSWVAENPTDVATARGYSETLESVEYTDHDGDSFDVRVIGFTSSVLVGDFWNCSATLLEVP